MEATNRLDARSLPEPVSRKVNGIFTIGTIGAIQMPVRKEASEFCLLKGSSFAFTRQRSLIRTQHSPLQKCRTFQVKRQQEKNLGDLPPSSAGLSCPTVERMT